MIVHAASYRFFFKKQQKIWILLLVTTSLDTNVWNIGERTKNRFWFGFPVRTTDICDGFPFGREGHSMPTPLCIRPTRRPIGYWSSTSGDSNPSPETFLTRFCIRNWSYQFIGGFNCHVVCNNLFDVADVQFSSLSNAVYVCISKAHLYWVVLLRFIRMSVRWALGDVQ